MGRGVMVESLEYRETAGVKLCALISIVLGSALGLVLLCAGGPSKVCPCFPYHKWIANFFDKVVGPFFTSGRRSGTIIRLVVGWSELVSGCIILACLWIDITQYNPDTLDTARAWCMQTALVQVYMLGAQALMFYSLNGGNPGASGYTAVLMVVFLGLRIIACPPWFQSFENQVFIFLSSMLTPLPFLWISWIRYVHGQPIRDLQPAYSSLKRPQGNRTLSSSPRYIEDRNALHQVSTRGPVGPFSYQVSAHAQRPGSDTRSAPGGFMSGGGYAHDVRGMPPGPPL